MARKSSKKRKNIDLGEFQILKYYCPNCRVLFQNQSGYEVLDKGKYRCKDCNKIFSNNSYKGKRTKGIYHLSKTHSSKEKKSVPNHKRSDIIKLWIEGHTIDAIHAITHYSRDIILEETKEYKAKNKVTYTFDKFIELLETEEDRERYNKIEFEYMKIRKIKKGLNMGCSVKQLTGILKMSPNTISKARNDQSSKENYTMVKDLVLEASKNKDDYDVIKLKQWIDNKHKYLKQLEIFNAEIFLQRDNLVRNSQRRTVKIDEEQGEVTFHGMSSEQQAIFEKKNAISSSPHTD